MCCFPKACLTRLQRSRCRCATARQPRGILEPARTDAGHRQPHCRDGLSGGGIACVAQAPQPSQMRVSLPWQPPHRLPAEAPPPARRPAAAPHRPSQPVRPSQPTRSRPTPPQRQTSGSEHRENQGAPPASKASAPAKASALRPPRPKRLLPPSPQNLRFKANRSSQSTCGTCDRRLGARLLHQRGLVRRRKQCAQGAVSFAAERGAARVPPDAGWRQGTRVRVRVGPMRRAARQKPPPPQSKRWDWKPWCSASSPHGKTSVDKTSFVNTEPTTRLLYVTKIAPGVKLIQHGRGASSPRAGSVIDRQPVELNRDFQRRKDFCR